MTTPKTETDRRSPLAEALREHNSVEVAGLMAQGATLGKDENAVKLVAGGITAHHFDQFSTQDINHMILTLNAAKEGGIDLNAPIDGEPAVHHLTRSYTRRWASNAYDRSEAAMYGLTADDQFDRLAAFAAGGVDFSQRDSQGRSFVATAEDELKTYAETHHPRSTKPDYSQETDYDDPSLALLQERMGIQLQGVKREARTQSVTRIAEAKKAAQNTMPRRRQAEQECPF